MADGALIVPPQRDIKAISLALRVTKRAAEIRAQRESWSYQETAVRGGRCRLYDVNELPEGVQLAVQRAEIEATVNDLKQNPAYEEGRAVGRRLAIAAAIDKTAQFRTMQAGLAAMAGLRGKPRARIDAKLDILTALNSFATHLGCGMWAAMEAFSAAYAKGEVGTAECRQILGDAISPRTLHRWRMTMRTKGAVGLAGDYGNKEWCGLIDNDMALFEFAVGTVVATPHIGGHQLYRAMQARFGADYPHIPTIRSVQGWLLRWKQENRQVFTAISNPDEWKNRYMVAMGNASEDATHLNARWEFDGTPSDVMLLDGRASIVGIIDVWSRRAMLYVGKTASAEAVCMALRRAVMAWGVPDKAKLDNGTDYVSQRVQRVFASLGVDVQLSAPFSPWQKPHIERFFRTFSHDLVEMLPGYIGHNVQDAQALRARQSFADRLTKKSTDPVEIRMTAVELQSFCDRWCRDIYERESRNGLDGMRVFERVASAAMEPKEAVDERVLDVLMAEAPGGSEDGLRTVNKKGLRVDSLYYAAPELGALVGERVQVLYDPADMGRIVVYHDGDFVCVAECPEILGVSRREVAVEARSRQKREVEAKRRELKALARKAKVRDIANEILDAKARENAALVHFPAPEITHLTPAIEAAREAAAALDAPKAPTSDLPPLTFKHFEDLRDMSRKEQVQDETEEGCFKRALELMVKEKAGELDELNGNWLAKYREGHEFRWRWQLFDEWGGMAFGMGDEFDHLSAMLSEQLKKEF